MRVECLQAEHLARIAALEALCFGEPWSAKALELLLTPDACGAVCTNGETIAAYGGMIFSPYDAQITNVAVHPDHRRCGYGRAILRALIENARARGVEAISLEVRASNDAAIALYQSEGFCIVGRRKGFYRHPVEDALVMVFALSE